MGDWWRYIPSKPDRFVLPLGNGTGEPTVVCGSDAERSFRASGPLFPDVEVKSSRGRGYDTVAELVVYLPEIAAWRHGGLSD